MKPRKYLAKRKVKRIIGILLAMILIMCCLSACTESEYVNTTVTEEPQIDWESFTLLERIEKSETFEEIVSCCNTDEGSNGYYENYDEEIVGESAKEVSEALSEKIISYLINKPGLNHIYYYQAKFIEDSWESERYGESLQDSVYFQIKSKDEVYIIPGDLISSVENIDLASIPNIADYTYKVINATIDISVMSLDFSRISDDYLIDFAYSEDPFIELDFYDAFPYQLDEEGNETVESSRTYYPAKVKAEWVADEKYAEDLAYYERKNSPPKVGMTSLEVLSSKWGSPDRKNVSEYSWGTSEQWVYDDYGYVYIENGVVTSISYKSR